MDLNALKELAYKAAEENIGLYNNVCNEIFTHPELATGSITLRHSSPPRWKSLASGCSTPMAGWKRPSGAR